MGSSSPHMGQPPHNNLSTDSDVRDESVYTVTNDDSSKQVLDTSPLLTNHRRLPSVDNDLGDSDNQGENSHKHEELKKPVTWSSLPNKLQLAILTCVQLSEPLNYTSLNAYMFYQLKSFDPSLPNSIISAQAGTLQGCFSAAQFLTAMFWGRLADAPWMGRKRVLLIGLSGTCLSSIGFGFSRSFAAALVFRTLGGVMNSNPGVMKTMITEIVVEKKYQSRAFLLLPMCFNVGVIIGPILGGSLADPVNSFPWLFGAGSVFGGKTGVWWMQNWPYALPNLLSAFFIILAFIAVFLGLDETHIMARYRSDWGRKLGKRITRALTRKPRHYQPLTRANDDDSLYVDNSAANWSAPSSPIRSRPPPPMRPHKRPGFRQIFSRNILLTLLAYFLLAFHTSGFNAMTFTFLPTPRAPENSRQGLFHFGGGLGLPSSRVGLATAIIGCIGLPLQIFFYPHIQTKLGTLTSSRMFLPLSPMAYLLMPFLVVLPRVPWVVWPAFTFVVSLQVLSRTFALPAATILVTNCVTDPSVLGMVHGVAQSIACGARTLGPMLGGWGLGLGLANNMVGGVWWALAVEALIGWLLLWTIHEGKGIEAARKAVDEEDDS